MTSTRAFPSCAAGALLLVACASAMDGGRGAPESLAGADFIHATGEAKPGATPLATATSFSGPAEASGARFAFAEDGAIGAFLVAGPFEHGRLPDDASLIPRRDQSLGAAGGGARWRSVAATDGVLDVIGSLDAGVRGNVAYAGGVVHVEHSGRHVFLVGVDDAVTIFVDGQTAFTSDRPRMRHDDDDLVAVDLGLGDHTVVFALRRHAHAWGLRVRLLDEGLEPPQGAWWELPGTSAEEARALLTHMSSVIFDRGMVADGYRPTLTVRFRGGAPRDVAIGVHVRLTRATSAGSADPLFDVDDVIQFGPDAAHDRTVALPPILASAVEDDDFTAHVDVAGRLLDLAFRPRRAVREAAFRARHAVEAARASPSPELTAESVDTIDYLSERLAGFVAKGDGDIEAQLADARELDGLSNNLEQDRDPYVERPDGEGGTGGWRTGPMRRAYRSPLDGHFSEFAVFVPPDFSPHKTYPLVVALHGMNGRPMQMLMWLFGHDDPLRDAFWEDRHPRRELEPLEAIVVAPDGHFNSMYREMGEDDVMRVVDWATATYPIDASRITITGPSMGGIGTAACALHHPDRFAAAEPLCGYHSYFVRSDIAGRTMRPWERFIAEERSNVFWAENGLNLPLYIVHGTKDLPEENSGVLIDRYEELHYDVEHEHPELGHNVWQPTYEDLKGVHWLLAHKRTLHPRSLRFKTPRTRWSDDAWLHVRELASSDAWGEVSARIEEHNRIVLGTRGVTAVALDRDTERIDDAAPVTVTIDGQRLTFQPGEPIDLHKAPERPPWRAGAAVQASPAKRGTITGPIRDVFHEPVLFVWGASDPSQSRANEEVAREWARGGWGIRIDYPFMSDAEFFARGEPLANDRALFLVGNARSNRLVRELEPSFPIRVDGRDILVGPTRISPNDGDAYRSQLGTIFIRPNPRRPDRYVVVVEGVGPLGTWRSASLPDMLPDYVVYDEGVASARGQLLLGSATLRAGGFFAQDWGLVTKPIASAVAPGHTLPPPLLGDP